jgi:hypothetical protein
MKNHVPLVLVILLSSCTKVINIDVRDTEIKYVIEGVITNEPGSCVVKISRSRNFNDGNDFEMISGADVQLTGDGRLITFTENSPGVYSNDEVTGTAGAVYNLSVNVDGSQFTSTCTMPHPVVLDSLYVSRGPFGQFKFSTVRYTDPAGVNNGYRFVQYVNGVKEPTIFWENDDFTDGQSVVMQLDASADEKDDPRNIKSGDEVTVEMQTLDEPVFNFWYTLRAEGGNGDGISAAPSNPVSNISGGALGYFSAHTVDRRMVIAP